MSTPIDKRDTTDPGDDVLRRFRYQFGYGVTLLVGAARAQLDYRAIWCEQHEDFLAEVNDQIFDAYQVKTRKPELGVWELNEEAMWKSIGRFVELDRKFPGLIRSFKLVSNAQYSDSSAAARVHLSPVKLNVAVRGVQLWKELSGAAKKGFELLNKKIGSTPEELFAALKRVDLVQGLTDRAFEDEICQTHLSRLPQCSTLSAGALARVREALITRIGEASSLFTDDPSRHWIALNHNLRNDPLLLAKRLTVEDLALIVREAQGGRFEYLPTLASLKLGVAFEQMDSYKKSCFAADWHIITK